MDPIRGLCFAEPIEVSGSYFEVWRRHSGAVVVSVRDWRIHDGRVIRGRRDIPMALQEISESMERAMGDLQFSRISQVRARREFS